ncbi:MAG: bifunctional 3-5 exonuclease/DNA polymerase, partial [Frondihabitans sp.]|nr:bifunctional 3-5 exonuclease/DNA polymerase [Frondihabitans sp.]
MFTLLVRRANERVGVTELIRGDDGRLRVGSERNVASADLAGVVRAGESASTRWVWDDTARWYPRLLEQGLRVDRCVDLRLCHALLRASASTLGAALHGAAPGGWDVPQAASIDSTALFVVEPESLPDPLGEFLLQRDAIEASPDRAKLELLTTAESTGAL